MNRIACSLLVAAAALAPCARAWADDAPTKEQIEAAKKAFGEGKELHDAGKLAEAVDKFKESYKLSKNPVLLYNIALTLDENKQSDDALFYYRKFLSDAPADAPQRKDVDARVKTLENDKLAAEMGTKPADAAKPAEPAHKKASTFNVADFQHTVVEDAPPNKPLDISATVPEGSDVSVVLLYRAAGQPEFTAKPMKWHGKDLVARIPAAAVTGSSIQYYIEVKDLSGNKITSSGKPTEPNLINLDPSAADHSFADFVDDVPVKEPKSDSDDPLHHGSSGAVAASDDSLTATGDGFTDAGSKKFEYTKWGVTAGAIAFIGVGVMFDIMASKQADALVSDSTRGSCTPHCTFDGYDVDLQSTGERDQMMSRIGLGIGIAGAAVAGYFWYRELTGHHHHETEPKVVVSPSVGQNFHGAAAAVRF